ncbi:hypothetical protein MOMA_03815 [Moraxella macacae 0408225]|uniref:Surface protein n=1 Tax=Moraxella macacae 0408225 TaxID=1230338 RepID=L2F8W0_9GAMM|nr:lysine exporter LysO family protein [Moraxella macacae]ELA09499.1 hypothetical protein MOMA_03815 [Moraxella macacae 0408225]
MLNNFLTLILILSPLVVGFFLPLPKVFVPYLDKLLGYLVFLILFCIGLSLAGVSDLGNQLGFIIKNVALLAVLTIGSGLLALWYFDKKHPHHAHAKTLHTKTKISIAGTLLQLGCLLIGLVVGKFLLLDALPIKIDVIVKGLLMLLVLLVGFGLSHAGMTLRQVLINKRGVQMSVIFCVSVSIGGVLFAVLTKDVSIMQGLALASGYGWYSLSGIIMTDAYGAVWGSVALLNDLLREFMALLCIPLLIRRYPSTAVGLGGVTTMDFTLPIIQASGGNEIVPLAMSFGFIVNIVSPVLMIVFSSF